MPMGWMYLDGCEILNDARFKQNIERNRYRFGNTTGVPIRFWGDLCRCYDRSPCAEPKWDFISYTDETNPWHDATDPISDEFFGFWVEDFKMDGTTDRQIDQLVSDGATFGPLRRNHREMTFSVIAAAYTSVGLRYGIDWLARRLEGCGAMHQGEAMVRFSCAPATDPGRDVWSLRDIGVIDGIKEGDPPLKRSSCKMQTITFTLAAADPYRYGCIEEILPRTRIPFDIGDCIDAQKWLCGPWTELRLCAEVPAPGAVKLTDISVVIESGATGSPYMRIRGAQNPLERECGDPALTPCMDILVAGLGPYEKLIVDTSTAAVWRVAANTSLAPTDALAYVSSSEDTLPTYMSLTGCDSAWVWVEPENGICLADDIYVTIYATDKVPR